MAEIGRVDDMPCSACNDRRGEWEPIPNGPNFGELYWEPCSVCLLCRSITLAQWDSLFVIHDRWDRVESIFWYDSTCIVAKVVYAGEPCDLICCCTDFLYISIEANGDWSPA